MRKQSTFTFERKERIGLTSASRNQHAWLLFEFVNEVTRGRAALAPVTFGISLEGVFNASAVRDTISYIINRHEALRTAFVPAVSLKVIRVEGWATTRDLMRSNPSQTISKISFTQVVHPYTASEPEVRDLEQSPPEKLQAEIAAITSRIRAGRFIYDQPPLLRSVLVKVTPTRQLLIMAVSHVVFDGWSREIFIREFGIAYAAFCEGRQPILPNLTIQFADFAIWDRARADTNEYAVDTAEYCERRFSGFSPLNCSDLSFVSRSGYVSEAKSKRESMTLQSDLCHRLKTFTTQHRVTSYMFILSVVAAVLCKYLRHPRLCLWTFFANRTIPQAELLIGLFANDHLLCIDMSDDPSFDDLLTQVRDMVFDAWSHQHITYTEIQGFLQRNATTAPSSSSGLQDRINFEMVVRARTMAETESSIVRRMWLGSANQNAFTLRLILSCVDDEIELIAHYRTDCFLQATIEGFLSSIERVARTVLVSPHLALSSVQRFIEIPASEHTR
jgi:hypothetical protein